MDFVSSPSPIFGLGLASPLVEDARGVRLGRFVLQTRCFVV